MSTLIVFYSILAWSTIGLVGAAVNNTFFLERYSFQQRQSFQATSMFISNKDQIRFLVLGFFSGPCMLIATISVLAQKHDDPKEKFKRDINYVFDCPEIYVFVSESAQERVKFIRNLLGTGFQGECGKPLQEDHEYKDGGINN